jgi:hypothetical protein
MILRALVAKRLSTLIRRALARALLAVTFASERRLDAFPLPRLQIKGMPLGFPDDVFLQNLALEPPERALDGFSVSEMYFGQKKCSFPLL